MSLNDIYRKYLSELQLIYSKGEAAKITELIFAHHGGFSRSDVIKDPMQGIGTDLLHKFETSLIRLMKHEPVQYVTEEAWFCNLRFKVSPAVLIPRPETEELVHEVLSQARDEMSVIDIGTGSGCIPVIIKKNLPQTKVTAIDTSRDALAIASNNALNNHADIEFIRMDFLREKDHDMLGQYDIIVSNPPYITEGEMKELDKNITSFEPHQALFVPDNDPIVFYKKIAAFAKRHLNKDGKIFLEIHETHANEVVQHFISEGFMASIQKDMFEKDRIVIVS